MMFHVEHIFACPVCGCKDSKHELTCKDFTVSKEDFRIVSCVSCGLYRTENPPGLNEIGAYYKSDDYISHTNSKKGLFNKAYQFARNRALRRKLRLVRELNSPKTLLDIGCGTGHFLRYVQSHSGIEVRGIEPDSRAAAIARSFQLNVDMPSEGYKTTERFDVITMWHVLEHVHDLAFQMQWIKDHLSQEGTLVIAVPNRLSYDANHYKEFWAAYDVPRHLWHFTANDIKRLASNFNMKVSSVRPMKMDSYYVSLLSERYRKGGIFSAIITGYLSNRKAEKSKPYPNHSSLIYTLKVN